MSATRPGLIAVVVVVGTAVVLGAVVSGAVTLATVVPLVDVLGAVVLGAVVLGAIVLGAIVSGDVVAEVAGSGDDDEASVEGTELAVVDVTEVTDPNDVALSAPAAVVGSESVQPALTSARATVTTSAVRKGPAAR